MVGTKTAMKADYIIVGGGSAGAVLANRLSEDPGKRVLLIEAGGTARSLLVQMPIGFAKLVANKKFDWCYYQEPDPSINGRRFLWPAGKLLGGGSSINGQVYIRGTKRDFDYWAESGATGWGFEDVMPYFLRSETWSGPLSRARGANGPLSVSPMRDFHPLCQNFLEGCNEAGLPMLTDYNGGEMEGAFLTQASQRNGWRCSTEKAYLRPTRTRPNLEIITNAEVETIHTEGGQAVGVTLIRDGLRMRADAAAEIIVCAGAMGTPALLMRSGIGPGDYLQSKGIRVVHDNQHVGRHLQEHPCVGQNKRVRVPTLNSQVGPHHMAGHMMRFLMRRKGPFSAPAVQAMGLARTRDELSEPDVQLHFLPLTYDIEPDTVSSVSAAIPKEPAIMIMATVCHPESRGRILLDAHKRPHIAHQLLGDQRDVDTLVDGMKLIDKIFNTAALRSLVVGNRQPPSVPTTDEAWEDFVRRKTAPAYHPVGTCRMGTGADAVVDPQLRVKGVARLRIADASVMPRLPSTNTNAVAIMIGEKAADTIRKGSRRSR
ncbi:MULTISPECIES: GMC family oxidoreductase [Paraburkholderia]|uniref:Glucose-methanol-choline oxidoreductase n=1 Tax=Paraburkholderia podalyriae TaxID=1938811 RepID=A0ABR7PV22_9BURK|nr:GMC family oxidoreductase N-terminal domain-containing protein [Paraburkholderia podalyriae]MBC8750137.1 glucose-methanol-choline oxidoreductase [Paraburkholderia podalyriae]